MSQGARISFGIMALVLFLVGWLHLTTPLLAILFSLFVLEKLHFTKSRLIAVLLYVFVVIGIGYAAVHFTREAMVALPRIAEDSIPSVISYAEAHEIELPFTDYPSLKVSAKEKIREQARYLGTFAKGATTQMVFLLIGMVAGASLFLNSQLDLDRGKHAITNNLYSLTCDEICIRFRTFYQSFTTVMGAQITISAINTALTSIFLLVTHMPNIAVVVGVTFLCGLLPVIGNLISNTIITCVAFTVSPQMALAALIFLIVIHKLEYFLNSKIIGDRIRNPVWLTLLGLIVGERLLGLPGMILAPVILNYLKVETARIEVRTINDQASMKIHTSQT